MEELENNPKVAVEPSEIVYKGSFIKPLLSALKRGLEYSKNEPVTAIVCAGIVAYEGGAAYFTYMFAHDQHRPITAVIYGSAVALGSAYIGYASLGQSSTDNQSDVSNSAFELT